MNSRSVRSECSRDQVLYVIATADGGLTCREIADRLDVATNQAQHALMGLLDAGLIYRRGEGGQADPYQYELVDGEVVDE